MEPEPERPWRRNAPNDLIVNSILAAIAAIVVQTIVTSGAPKYWIGWVIAAFISLFLFVISAERAGESIREGHIKAYISSMNCYNIGVLFLFISLCAIFSRYTNWSVAWSIVVSVLLWLWFWGLDTLFLIFGGKDYDRWKQKMDGEVVTGEGEISDLRDMLIARMKSFLARTGLWRH